MESAPLLVSFSSIRRALAALPPAVVDSYGAEFSELTRRDLPPAVSLRCIATLFGYSTEFLGAMYRHPERYYRKFPVKTGTKTRIIYSPRVSLKAVQKWIGHHLAAAHKWPDYVVGFVPGRSAILGAGRHCLARWVYSVDIRDFFMNTRATLVMRGLAELGYSTHASQVIAGLCTRDGVLPQGAPSSPVLSNLAFASADLAISDYAILAGIRYTRYADDLVFSGQEDVPSSLVDFVRGVIVSHGWEVSAKKEQLAELPQRLKVYGLLVHGHAPQLTKGYRNRLRAYRHLLAAGKIANEDRRRVLGHVAYERSLSRYRNDFP